MKTAIGNFLLKKKIEKETKKLTIEQIKSNDFPDCDTWINWQVNWPDELKNLFDGFFQFENGDKNYCLCIEYWLDVKKIKYLLQCDDDTIEINHLISNKYLDDLVLQAVSLC